MSQGAGPSEPGVRAYAGRRAGVSVKASDGEGDTGRARGFILNPASPSLTEACTSRCTVCYEVTPQNLS